MTKVQVPLIASTCPRTISASHAITCFPDPRTPGLSTLANCMSMHPQPFPFCSSQEFREILLLGSASSLDDTQLRQTYGFTEHISRNCSAYRGGRRSFSLKAANRLARGSSVVLDWRPDGSCNSLEAGWPSDCRGRLGIRSPVDCRIACKVLQPSVDRS